MNIAQKALARGAAVLQRHSPGGEVVTYNGNVLHAVVNRLPERPQPRGMEDVGTGDGSIIELPVSLTAPRPGETITDAFSYTHAIKTVKHIGHAWRCECEVTR